MLEWDLLYKVRNGSVSGFLIRHIQKKEPTSYWCRLNHDELMQCVEYVQAPI